MMTQEPSSTEAAREPVAGTTRIAERGIVARGLRLATAMNDVPAELKRRVPLVVLPAAGYRWSDYQPILEHFGADRRVFALDWPGFGASAKPAPDAFEYDAAAYADLLAPWLTSLGVSRAVLLGNGIGGAAAMHFAVAHPERVLGLLLVAPAGFAAPGLTRTIATRVLGVPALLARLRPLLTNLALGPTTPETQRIRAEQNAATRGPEREATLQAEAALWRSLGHSDADLTRVASQIRASAILVRGALDPLFSAGDARRATGAIGTHGAVEVVLPEAGHLPFIQQARRFNQALAGLLGAAEYRAVELS